MFSVFSPTIYLSNLSAVVIILVEAAGAGTFNAHKNRVNRTYFPMAPTFKFTIYFVVSSTLIVIIPIKGNLKLVKLRFFLSKDCTVLFFFLLKWISEKVKKNHVPFVKVMRFYKIAC